MTKSTWATPELYFLASGNEATEGAGKSKGARVLEGTTGGCDGGIEPSNCPGSDEELEGPS